MGGRFWGDVQQYYIGAPLSCQNSDSRQDPRRVELPAPKWSTDVDWSTVPLRIGLFGGTFDPPHVGHLVTAVNVRYALNLDLVVLMVANSPWQKQGTRSISPAADRLAMVAAAVADVDGAIRPTH
jgi:cytidyltransferase-like protein